MTCEEFIARMKLRGYRESHINALADYARENAAPEGSAMSEPWYLQDLMDVCFHGGGMKEALYLIGKKDMWEKRNDK